MTDPKELFDNPDQHWQFLTSPTDSSCEGQYFDREALPPGIVSKSQYQSLIEEITATVSAFSNQNRRGGLVVVGIDSDGGVIGTSHLTEQQRNSISNIGPLLTNQAAHVRTHPCTGTDGKGTNLTLIYAPYATTGICETPGPRPKAWVRQDAQNIPVDQHRREQLLREKRIGESGCGGEDQN